jgi:HD-GYP domain-containing protein (c-di-GMP phosphodiesterase class II)
MLRSVQEQSRTLFQLNDCGPSNAIQASEIDRLDETLAHLLGELKQQMERQKRLERNDLIQTITALATAIEARDPYTRNHSRSVARWSVRLGRAMGLRRDHLYEMHLAGLMHDIGKIGVPDEVLLKPGKLTPQEVLAIQAHVEWSYSIISPITSLKQVSAIVRHHHERFDGKGYPDRLAGMEIPLGARIMAVVDMFVAMTEDRPYRQGLTIDTAVAELRRVAGTQIDPTCMEAFLDLLESDGLLDARVDEPAPDITPQPRVVAQDEDEPESKRAAAN